MKEESSGNANPDRERTKETPRHGLDLFQHFEAYSLISPVIFTISRIAKFTEIYTGGGRSGTGRSGTRLVWLVGEPTQLTFKRLIFVDKVSNFSCPTSTTTQCTWSYKLMFGVIYNPTRKSLYYQNLKNLAKNGAITKLSKEKRGNEKCDWLNFKPRFKGNGMKNWPLKRLHCSFISKEILLWAWRASILLLSPGLPPRFFLSIRARSKELWV